MKLLDFIPVKLTLLLILGIITGECLDPEPYIPASLTGTALVILGILFTKQKIRKHTAFGFVMTSVVLGIGMLAISMAKAESLPNTHLGKSSDEDHLWHLKIREVLKPNAYSCRYVAIIQGVDSVSTKGRLLLTTPIDSTMEILGVDDELTGWGPIQDIRPPMNPHQFNFKRFMDHRGITYQIRIDPGECILKTSPSETLYGIAANVRNAIVTNLKQAGFGRDELSIIQALLLGQRQDISEDIYNSYKNAGAVHILAVSGLHIGVLLLFLHVLLKPLERFPKGKMMKLAAMVAILWGYALLAGFSASVVRAVSMFSFVAYAIYLNRPGNTFNTLALSMFFVLLVISPLLLFQVGFQMSYAAVFAIVWIYPKLQRFWYPKNRLIRKVWQLLSVSLAAQMGVLPVSLYYFHQFPGLFFISNLLIIPFLGCILGFGFLITLLAVSHGLPDFLVAAYNGLIYGMNNLVGWIAQQEAFIFREVPFDGFQVVLSYFLIYALVLALQKGSYHRVIFLLTAIIVFQLWIVLDRDIANKQEKLIVMHQTGRTLLFHQRGSSLVIHASDTVNTAGIQQNFTIAERIDTLIQRPLGNSYYLEQKKLLIIDSLGIVREGMRPDILLLTHSPKINLERCLNLIHPEQIIADGSNYRNDADRWRLTCAQKKIPFHYTGEMGAYYLQLNSD